MSRQAREAVLATLAASDAVMDAAEIARQTNYSKGTVRRAIRELGSRVRSIRRFYGRGPIVYWLDKTWITEKHAAWWASQADRQELEAVRDIIDRQLDELYAR